MVLRLSKKEHDIQNINPVTKVTITIPRHAKGLGKGIENAILREANLK